MSKTFKRNIAEVQIFLTLVEHDPQRFSKLNRLCSVQGISLSRFRNALRWCLEEKYIRRPERGLYEITARGSNFLASLRNSGQVGITTSVVAHVCSYNGEDVLPKFFEKYDQLVPIPDHTIFVINNCTDRTYEILRDWNETEKTIIAPWFVSDLIKRCRSEYAGLAIARQLAYDYIRVLRCPWDFVWQLDDDMLLRHSDSLGTLTAWDVDVVGGTYWRDFPTGRYITAKWLDINGNVSMKDKIYAPLMEPAVVGGGCILMKRKVALDPRCYVWPLLGNAAEDFGFGLRIRDAGYNIFLDGIVMIDHLIVRSRHVKAWTKRDDMLDWEM